MSLCDCVDSKLDVTIHFHEHHFALENNYKFNIYVMNALGVERPGAQSLYLFLPNIQEKDILVSLVVSQDFKP